MKSLNKESERGSAGVKLVFVLVVIGLIFHAGYNYIPVAYEGETIKQEMQTAVLKGVSMPAINKTPQDVVRESVVRTVRVNGAPADAVIEVKPVNNVISAHVRYTKKVNILPFGLYKYEYVFNETATPTGFLLKDS